MRGLDLGTVPVYLEAESPRVNCLEHGVTVAAVPWARHDSRFTQAFEDSNGLAGDPDLALCGLGTDESGLANGGWEAG